MRCPFCGETVDEEFYCSNCGAELEEDEVDYED